MCVCVGGVMFFKMKDPTLGEKDLELENYDNITLYSIYKVFGGIRMLITPRGRAGE